MNKKIMSVLLSLDKNLIKEIKGSTDLNISGLTYDSRMVLEDFVFFALPGLHLDGSNFILNSIKRGSKVIVHTNELKSYEENITYIHVDASDIKKFMSNFSNIFYDEPSKKLKVVGVTGTDGKSSVCFYIYTLLKQKGFKVGFISTVFFDDGSGNLVKNPYRQSTPESTEIHAFLHKMVGNGVEYAILESTSHGLDPRTSRLLDVNYSVAVFTNLTHEHLEFHGTIENYCDAKINLFKATDKNNGFGIINLDDIWSCAFKDSIKKYFTYSLKNKEADFFVTKVNEQIGFTEFEFIFKENKYFSKINLTGSFNVENVLASLISAHVLTSISIFDLTNELRYIKSLDGRMNSIELGQNFSVIVDYAHTPGSFKKLFPIFKKLSKNKLIAVFGSAGERDVPKREVQGEIADLYADIIILCDEDPRAEGSMRVISDIAAGIKNKTLDKTLFFIPDRKKAIEKAVSLAEAGDLIVALGKGHENSIIYEHSSVHWDEKKVLKDAILSLV